MSECPSHRSICSVFTTWRHPCGILQVLQVLHAARRNGAFLFMCRQLFIGGSRVPNSRGVSFFRVNSARQIEYIRESPEHFVKITAVALPTLSLMSPLLAAARPFLSSLPDASTVSPEAEPISFLRHVSTSAGRSLVSLLPKEWTQAQSSAAPPAVGARSDATPSIGPSTPLPEDRARASASSSDDDNVVPMVRTVTGGEVAMRSLDTSSSSDAETPGYADSAVRRSVRTAVIAPATDTDSDSEYPAGPLRGANKHAGLFAGLWQKIKERSDLEGYGRALELMGVGGIQRATAMLIDGVEVHHTKDTLEVFYLTVVPYFKVRESYRFNVEVAQARRDLRSGRQTAVAQQAGHRVIVDISWGTPNPGEVHEEYWLDDVGCLHVESTVTVNGDSETTLQVRVLSAVDFVLAVTGWEGSAVSWLYS
jgi:hypothetical protein